MEQTPSLGAMAGRLQARDPFLAIKRGPQWLAAGSEFRRDGRSKAAPRSESERLCAVERCAQHRIGAAIVLDGFSRLAK
jgi:hypothetical protein